MAADDQNNVEKKYVSTKGFVLVVAALMMASIFLWYSQDDIQEWTQPLQFMFSRYNYHLMYASEKSVVVCLVPKVASTVLLMLVKRMNGDPNWSSRTMQDIRDGHREGVRNADVVNPNITKMAMVRNPVDRVLSAYLNKIFSARKYNLLPKGSWATENAEEPPPFEEFISIIESVPQQSLNKHFKPQSMLCETKKISYTFALDFENRKTGMREFLEAIGHWEDMGASGWGPNGTAPIFAEMENIKRGRSVRPPTVSEKRDEKVQEYYTRELLEKVFQIYEQDYIAFEEFGWSRDANTYLNLSSA
ncbi:hypothetical protein BSKO_00802 [Bryopsis sp. KO-2023]|nr:hypothetical protein BSKO_00802 [Bryopsis sp. KO-2023]